MFETHLALSARRAVATWVSLLAPLCGPTIQAAIVSSPHPFDVVAYQNFDDVDDRTFQVNSIGSSDSTVSNSAAAQQFVAIVAGKMSALSVFVKRETFNPGPPLIIEIRSSIADLPANLLGTIQVGSGMVPTEESLLTFDFNSENVHLNAGDSYFAVFQTNPPPGNLFGYYRLHFVDGDLTTGQRSIHSTTGGAGPWSDSSLDRSEEIGLFVHVVPEPSTVALAAFGLLVIAGRRRK